MVTTETFKMSEIEDEVKGRNRETENRYYLEEYCHPFSFYIRLMTTSLSETNPAIMALYYETPFFPSWSTRLLTSYLTSVHTEETSLNCFPVSSEHLITRNRLKRGKSVPPENIILYNHNVSRSKFKLCDLNLNSKLWRQIFFSWVMDIRNSTGILQATLRMKSIIFLFSSCGWILPSQP